MEKGKLVRDRIPDIIRSNSEEPVILKLSTDEYKKCLLDKLVEKAMELREGPCLEEMADIHEVLLAIMQTFGFSDADIEQTRIQKLKDRGGFTERIFLVQE